ncbi:MAG: LytTR family DNA-binding domain-containing protein [Mycobacteriales bacterium]|nr:LytTR family DNA-binding domain-containing protein [Mycobacteriales bacterium]
MTRQLAVLAVDDEPPALDELAFLLRADPRVGSVRTATDATTALRAIDEGEVDAVFLDIRMPGLSGIDLARVLGRFADPPQVVFVTAHDQALDAFALGAVDYLLKPLRQERLAEAVGRLIELRADGAAAAPPDNETIAVELGGVTRFVARDDVLYVEASGDYARLHTATGNHLVRVALATLEERWARAGFVRVHRSYLVAAGHITELRVEPGGGNAVQVGGTTIPVSRRHARELKDRLVRRARTQSGERG